jgi:hypothetical protein
VVSELALIRRREAVPEGVLASDDPFRQGETRLVPWLSEPRLRPGDDLSVFMVVYAPTAGLSRVLLEYLRDGKVVSQSLAELPAAVPYGRTPIVSTVPVVDLEPGQYEVRALVKQGGLVAHRAARFVLEEGER